MAFKARKFAFHHPTFGRSKAEKAKEPYKNSVYYYWWEFLRRSEEYQKCCESGGKGKLRKFYADFGDVLTTDFKTWWQTDDRGVRLFAEEMLPQFKEVSEIDLSNIPPYTVFLQVPMSLPKRYLTQQFQKVLQTHHKGKRGVRTNKASTAKYPVTGHVDLKALDNCLRVYDMRMNNPKMCHWEIAQVCIAGTGKMAIKTDGSDHKSDIVVKKNILASISRRYVKKAEGLIESVVKGKFPGGK